MSGIAANKTKIYYAKQNSGEKEYVELPSLMEVPEFGGTPEKIDVTTLSDSTKRFVNGITDMGDLVFKFLYDNSSETSNYRVLKGMQEQNTLTEFKLTYPDGTSHLFSAYVAVKMDAAAVNGALTFSCSMLMQSDITVENPTVA